MKYFNEDFIEDVDRGALVTQTLEDELYGQGDGANVHDEFLDILSCAVDHDSVDSGDESEPVNSPFSNFSF